MTGRLRMPAGMVETASVVNGEWQSDDIELLKFLVTKFPVIDVSPADGLPGAKQLRDAAAALGGSIEWAEQPAAEPGVVY